jgi:DNA-binding protein H-NS
MSKTYAQIQKEIETLQREAEKLRRKEVDDVIGRIKEAIRVYELTAADLGFSVSAGRRRGGAGKSAGRSGKGRPASQVKYRDESGNTWGGRGPRPQWLREALSTGKTLQDFAV